MESTALALLGLGANLGDQPEQTLRQACRKVEQVPGIRSLLSASFYRSAPVDAPGPFYTNSAALVRTTLSPLNLLDSMQQIEHDFGRNRDLPSVRNAPRTLDIDILWYDGVQIDTPRIILPHPRMQLRAFVLKPLIELVGPDFNLHGVSLRDWQAKCQDQACWRVEPAK